MSHLVNLPIKSLLKAITDKCIVKFKNLYSSSPLPEKKTINDTELFSEIIDTFEDDSGMSFDVFSHYRNSVKNRWRLYWPYEVLRYVDQHHDLDHKAKAILDEVDNGITFPSSSEEIIEVIAPYIEKYSDSFVFTGLHDNHVNHKVVRPRMSHSEAQKTMQRWLGLADGLIVKLLPHLQRDLSQCHSLEIGCGKGYLTHALKSQGFHTSVGIDSTEAGYSDLTQKDEVITLFPSHGELKVENIEKTDFEDDQFDLIVSTSVLEHISNLPLAFEEIARILKPGGTVIHNFDPFFSPQGGHSFCILDFPWGHARLSPQSFEDYLKKYRPHELNKALDFYQNQFNQPRITLAEVQNSLIEVGFSLHEWTEHKFSSHIPLVTKEILDQVKRHYPRVEVRDLLTSGVHFVATLKKLH